MKLPESVLACKLQYGTNLKQSERQLIYACAHTIDYSFMKPSLRRIFSRAYLVKDSSANNDPVMKKNLVCFTISLKRRSNCFLDKQAVYPPRKNFRGNGQNHDPRRQQEKNPLDRQGKMTLCSCCGS